MPGQIQKVLEREESNASVLAQSWKMLLKAQWLRDIILYYNFLKLKISVKISLNKQNTKKQS